MVIIFWGMSITLDFTYKKRLTNASRVGKGQSHPTPKAFGAHRTVREPLNSYGSYYAIKY
jgi:hypothetical protein